MSATVALLTSISMAFAIVAIVRTIDEMEMAYLRGFEDAVFKRGCNRERAFDDTKEDAQ